MLGLEAALYSWEVCGTVSLCVARIHILDPSPIEMKSNFRRGFEGGRGGWRGEGERGGGRGGEGAGGGRGEGISISRPPLWAPVPLLLLNTENSSNASVCILHI
jgi:hypothetical protein